LGPQFPGAQIHGALGVERGGVEVVGVALGEFAHRLLVIESELFLVGLLGVGGVALGESLDVSAFVRRGGVGQGEGFLDGGVGGFELGFLGVEVVIGSDG